MTDADKLRAILTRLNLSQRGAARVLEIDERTLRRWCMNQLPVPAVIWLALESLERNPNP